MRGISFTLFIIFLTQVLNAQTSLPGPNIGDTGSVTFFYQGQYVTHTIVRAADSNVWLQQNLGSLKVADSFSDVASYGHYFQWGRWDDGHQIPNTPVKVVNTLAANDPTGINFCVDNYLVSPGTSAGTSAAPYWWQNGDTASSWTSSLPTENNGFDPCALLGDGWHIGDSAEWANIYVLESITASASAMSSNLKISGSGFRQRINGVLTFIPNAIHWTSTPAGPLGSGQPQQTSYSVATIFGGIYAMYREAGMPVRCVLKHDAVVSWGISGDDTVCAGPAVNFTINEFPFATTYSWELPDGWEGQSDSSSIDLVVSGNGGIIKVYVVNQCDDTIAVRSKYVEVNTIEPIISVDSFTLSTTQPYVTYQWYLDGNILPEATNSSYTVSENGAYTVLVTDSFGCEAMSPPYHVNNATSIAVPGAITANTYIYPNPAKDVLYINSTVKINAILSSIEGRTIRELKEGNILSLQGIAEGVYLLRILDNDNRLIKVEKIVKR